MRVIVIGCEYSGKSTFARALKVWGENHGFMFHLDDHLTFPDSSLPKKDRDVILKLSPVFKERYQRFQIIYHVRLLQQWRDAIEVGFYSEDDIYGYLYYGYEELMFGGARAKDFDIRRGRELEKEIPNDTILVLMKASPKVIEKRMEEAPQEYQVIKKEDIGTLLKKFDEEFQLSVFHAKISIDTSSLTPEQVLEEFLVKARLYLTSEDQIRIIFNERK